MRNLLLIEPPDSLLGEESGLRDGSLESRFSPPWPMLCAQAYVHARTRHHCDLFDARLVTNVERDLIRALKKYPQPPVAAIHMTPQNTPEAVTLIEIIRHHLPDQVIVLFGTMPTEFPERTMELGKGDYFISGDPEPVLKNVLDYADIPQRLQRLQGLSVVATGKLAEPFWLEDLQTINLTDWRGVDLNVYKEALGQHYFEADLRISRGNTGLPPDRSFGGKSEPLRFYDIENLATCIQLCSTAWASHIFLNDPPAVWTPERLSAWCDMLKRMQNQQAWGLRFLPTVLDEEQVTDLSMTFCRRVSILVPSCDPDILRTYGVILKPSDFLPTIQLLHENRIHVTLDFLIGGPNEPPGEARRIMKMVESLHYCDFKVRPFPLNFDAPLYDELGAHTPHMKLEERIRNIRELNEEALPPLIWSQDPETLQKDIRRIEKKLEKSLRRFVVKHAQTFWRNFKERHVKVDIPDSYAPLEEKKNPPRKPRERDPFHPF